NVPKAYAGPLRLVVRPPAHAVPAALLVNAQSPGACANIIAADDIRRTKAETVELKRIVEVAYRWVVRQAIRRHRPLAARKRGATAENCRCPFRKTAKSFRDSS